MTSYSFEYYGYHTYKYSDWSCASEYWQGMDQMCSWLYNKNCVKLVQEIEENCYTNAAWNLYL